MWSRPTGSAGGGGCAAPSRLRLHLGRAGGGGSGSSSSRAGRAAMLNRRPLPLHLGETGWGRAAPRSPPGPARIQPLPQGWGGRAAAPEGWEGEGEGRPEVRSVPVKGL